MADDKTGELKAGGLKIASVYRAPLTTSSTPKFNCSRMDGVITITLNTEMAKALLSLMQDFYSNELSSSEFALMKYLEKLVGTTEERK